MINYMSIEVILVSIHIVISIYIYLLSLTLLHLDEWVIEEKMDKRQSDSIST